MDTDSSVGIDCGGGGWQEEGKGEKIGITVIE